MIKWISKFWKWLIGVPVIIAIASIIFRRRHREPDPIVPTRKETDERHEKIEEKKKESIESARTEIDREVDDVLKNFGG
jgi:hypothetical protein